VTASPKPPISQHMRIKQSRCPSKQIQSYEYRVQGWDVLRRCMTTPTNIAPLVDGSVYFVEFRRSMVEYSDLVYSSVKLVPPEAHSGLLIACMVRTRLTQVPHM